MRMTSLMGWILFAFSLGFLATVPGEGSNAGASRAPLAWEYRVDWHPETHTPQRIGQEMGKAGDQGWECIGIYSAPRGETVSVFKRPKR